jgi:hypothetical protein
MARSLTLSAAVLRLTLHPVGIGAAAPEADRPGRGQRALGAAGRRTARNTRGNG